MTERIKLNKVSLREQKQKLGLYRRFLPALEARKQQFLLQLGVVRKDIQMRQEALTDLLKEIEPWSALIWDHEPLMRYFLEIEEVRSSVHNVAGLKIPRFEKLIFSEPPSSVFATAYSFETVLDRLRAAISLREELRILKEQEKIISDGFRKTSQRINLYEQRLIPQCREALRKIAVYLQDQQAAAVGVAKTAKRLSEGV